jgi:hypothetical protein
MRPLHEQINMFPPLLITFFMVFLDPAFISPSLWLGKTVGPFLHTEVPPRDLVTIENIVKYARDYPEAFVFMNANLFTILGFAVVITAQVVSIVLIAQKAAKNPRTPPWGESWEGCMWVCTMYAIAGAVIAPCTLDIYSFEHRAGFTNPFILWGCVWLVLYVMLVLMACGLVKLNSWAKAQNIRSFVILMKWGGWVAGSVGTALLTMCIGVNIPKFLQLWRDVQRMQSDIPWSDLKFTSMLDDKLVIAQCLFRDADRYSKVLACGKLPNLWQRVMDTHPTLFVTDQVLYLVIGHSVFHGTTFATKLASHLTVRQLQVASNAISRLGGSVPMIGQCLIFVGGTLCKICPPTTGLITQVSTWIADSCFYLVIMNMAAKLRQQQAPKMPSGTSIGVCVFAGLLVLGLTVVVYRKVVHSNNLSRQLSALKFRGGR